MMRLRPQLVTVFSLILCCALLPSPAYAAANAVPAAKESHFVSYLSSFFLHKLDRFHKSVVTSSPNLDDQQGTWISAFWKRKDSDFGTPSSSPGICSSFSPHSLEVSCDWIVSLFTSKENSTPILNQSRARDWRVWFNSLFTNEKKTEKKVLIIAIQPGITSTIKELQVWVMSLFSTKKAAKPVSAVPDIISTTEELRIWVISLFSTKKAEKPKPVSAVPDIIAIIEDLQSWVISRFSTKAEKPKSNLAELHFKISTTIEEWRTWITSIFSMQKKPESYVQVVVDVSSIKTAQSWLFSRFPQLEWIFNGISDGCSTVFLE
jgi:hypothetical protein